MHLCVTEIDNQSLVSHSTLLKNEHSELKTFSIRLKYVLTRKPWFPFYLSHAVTKRNSKPWIMTLPRSRTSIYNVEENRETLNRLLAYLLQRTAQDGQLEPNMRLVLKNLDKPWLEQRYCTASTFHLHAYKLYDLSGIRPFETFQVRGTGDAIAPPTFVVDSPKIISRSIPSTRKTEEENTEIGKIHWSRSRKHAILILS